MDLVEARRVGEGDDRIAMGGGQWMKWAYRGQIGEIAGVVLLVCNWWARQGTINQRAAACGKGVSYMFPPAEAISLQDWRRRREI